MRESLKGRRPRPELLLTRTRTMFQWAKWVRVECPSSIKQNEPIGTGPKTGTGTRLRPKGSTLQDRVKKLQDLGRNRGKLGVMEREPTMSL